MAEIVMDPNRRTSPATGCKANQDALRQDGYDLSEECPVCEISFGIKCQVALHPTAAEQAQAIQGAQVLPLPAGLPAPVPAAAAACPFPESITPSKASAKKVKWLKKKLGITYEKKVTVKEMLAYYGTDPPADDRIFPSMPQPQDGAHFAKVAAAMDHARTNLLPFIPHLDNCFAFKNVSEWTHLWDMDIDGQSVHGTTDIVIAPHDAVDEADGLSPEVLVCFKLKPPPAPGLAMDWNSYALQAKVELMAACCASKRALVCFVTDFISGALSLRIAELADQTFGIVQAQLTLTQMAQVVAAVLKPEFRTVAYRPEEQVVEMPGPLRDAARFKRRFEETYEALDNDEEEKLKDLMQDEELPAHFKKQAIRDYLASYGLHSNILDAELAAFRAKQRDGDKDDPWYSMHTCTPSGRKK